MRVHASILKAVVLALVLMPMMVWAQRGEVTLSRDTALELVTQMEALQAELRQLRNQVETQAYEVERLKESQRQMMQDIEQRVSTLERAGPTAATTPTGTTTTPTRPSSTTAIIATPTSSRTTPPTTPTAPVNAKEQREYDAAFTLLKQGRYTRASQAFRAFLQKYPQSPLASNAQYWTAEANYVVRNFGQALEEFNKVVTQYPESQKVPDALLKIGYSYYELRTWDKARQALTSVVERFPNTTVAKLAQIRLTKMKEEGH